MLWQRGERGGARGAVSESRSENPNTYFQWYFRAGYKSLESQLQVTIKYPQAASEISGDLTCSVQVRLTKNDSPNNRLGLGKRLNLHHLRLTF